MSNPLRPAHIRAITRNHDRCAAGLGAAISSRAVIKNAEKWADGMADGGGSASM